MSETHHPQKIHKYIHFTKKAEVNYVNNNIHIHGTPSESLLASAMSGTSKASGAIDY